MRKPTFILLFVMIALQWTLMSVVTKAQSQAADSEPVYGIQVGNKAPDIELSSPDGKVYKLSSLKGYYVLIDFWASWCGPCRRENPNVVEAWNKYKDRKFKDGKGLKFYSVSLDRQKEAWVKAIAADKLDWEYHVSDLKYWQSAAAQAYGVNSIPSNFLLDPKGVIVAKNLRGLDLHYQLEKYTKTK